MKLTPSSTARRRTASAPLRSFGGPHIPSPVRRIAPKPRRWTESLLPSETFPARIAEISFALILFYPPESTFNYFSFGACRTEFQPPGSFALGHEPRETP